MAQDGGSGRKNQDNNGSSGSNLLLWAGLIVATGLLLILWVPSYFTRELDPKDFKKLVEASPREEKGGKVKEGFDGYIDVREKDKHYRYSDPRKLVINDRSFSGTVDVVELIPQGANKNLEPSDKGFARDVTFRTNIDPKAKYGQDIIDLMDASNIDFRYASGPTSFDQH